MTYKPKITSYQNGAKRYYERVPGDTIGLIIYVDSKGSITIENSAGMTEKQIDNRVKKHLLFIGLETND